jgi:cytochrome c oxidase assembly factor CtaG
MLGHMLLGMMILVLLSLRGADHPRTAPSRKRSDGSRGAGVDHDLVHSRIVLSTNPIVAAALFVVSPLRSTTRRCSAGRPRTTSATPS